MIIKPLTDRKWRGYTFEELQDQRILTDARITIQKNLLEDRFRALRPGGNTGSTTRKVFSALGYLDYIMLGAALFRKIRPWLRFIRRKKKG